MRDVKRTGIVIGGGLAVSVGLLVFAFWPMARAPFVSHERSEFRSSNRPAEAVAESESAEGDSIPTNSPNVYVRRSDGVLTRPGERIPEIVPESDEARQQAEVQGAWDRLIVEYAHPLGREIGERDTKRFADALHRFPRAKRLENLKAAENLLPPENLPLVLSLALEKSMPEEIVKAGFDACLNDRSAYADAVIAAVARDKSHPNHVDAARIIDIRRLSN